MVTFPVRATTPLRTGRQFEHARNEALAVGRASRHRGPGPARSRPGPSTATTTADPRTQHGACVRVQPRAEHLEWVPLEFGDGPVRPRADVDAEVTVLRDDVGNVWMSRRANRNRGPESDPSRHTDSGDAERVGMVPDGWRRPPGVVALGS